MKLKTRWITFSAILFAALPAAAELRIVTLDPTQDGGYHAVLEGKVKGGAAAIVAWADGKELDADWRDAGGRYEATLPLAGAKRFAVGTAGKKGSAPEAVLELAPIEDGFGGWTVYHIMLGYFRDGNKGNDGEIDGWRHANYAGGDLQGVREKVDYLAGLGVTAVWLSPMFQSNTSHGYDVRNYYRLGDAVAVPGDAEASLALFRGLVKDLHEKGIRVILDLPLNHASKAYDFKTGDPEGLKPRSTPARQEAEKVWESWGAGFRYWNFGDESTRRFLMDAALYWLVDEGADGLRLDYVRGVEHDFWAELYDEVQEKKPGAFLVGECWKDADGADSNAAEIAHYYEPVEGQPQFSSLLDFPMQILATGVFARGGSAADLEAWLQRYPTIYGEGAQPTFFLDNHDMARFLSWTDDDDRLVAAVGFLASLSSPMVIFYGTETGLRHAAPRPGFIDVGRIPMPWDSLNQEMIGRVSAFLKARREHPSLTHGGRLPIFSDQDVLVMVKIGEDETALVGVNLGTEERRVELGAAVPAGTSFTALGTAPVPEASDGGWTWRLPPGATSIVFAPRL